MDAKIESRLVICLSVAYLVIAASLFIHEQYPHSEIINGWLAPGLLRVRGWPWPWILTSFGVGGVAVGVWGSVFHRRRQLREREAEQLAPKIEILTPLDGWYVGSLRTIGGLIFPPASRMQLLIRPYGDCWHVEESVLVDGGAWACKFIHCPDESLHQSRIADTNAIQDLVKVCMINCELNIDAKDGEQTFVDFRFWFLNLSLFSVSIESIEGKITFRHETSAEIISLDGKHKLFKEDAMDRPFRADGFFIVRKFLEPQDLNPIRSGSDKSLFYLKELDISVSGEGFDLVRLKVPTDFIYKGKAWRCSAECDFLFASMAQAEDKVRELEAENQSLQSRLEVKKEDAL